MFPGISPTYGVAGLATMTIDGRAVVMTTALERTAAIVAALVVDRTAGFVGASLLVDLTGCVVVVFIALLVNLAAGNVVIGAALLLDVFVDGVNVSLDGSQAESVGDASQYQS